MIEVVVKETKCDCSACRAEECGCSTCKALLTVADALNEDEIPLADGIIGMMRMILISALNHESVNGRVEELFNKAVKIQAEHERDETKPEGAEMHRKGLN